MNKTENTWILFVLLLLDLDKQSANMKKAAAWSKKENTNN